MEKEGGDALQTRGLYSVCAEIVSRMTIPGFTYHGRRHGRRHGPSPFLHTYSPVYCTPPSHQLLYTLRDRRDIGKWRRTQMPSCPGSSGWGKLNVATLSTALSSYMSNASLWRMLRCQKLYTGISNRLMKRKRVQEEKTGPCVYMCWGWGTTVLISTTPFCEQIKQRISGRITTVYCAIVETEQDFNLF